MGSYAEVSSRQSRRRLKLLIPALIAFAATLLVLSASRPWPSTAPLADPGTEPITTLSAALASPFSEHLDRLLYAAIRQLELEEPAANRLAGALREAAAVPGAP